ncbi:MAG: SLC13/DASS family transporter [Crocinitomicaceae bacterium]|nr:SLC13/DASS family transporter [Crocinitomicaceae bacterium]
MKLFRKIGLFAGPIALILMLLIGMGTPQEATYKVLGVALLMIIWWITETVHLAVTALMPLILFPLMGVLDSKELASMYGSNIVFLFMGGFIIALAMEKWELHRRIALKIINTIGISPVRVLLGFMIATALLSMWISNTATTVMMIPIVGKVLSILHDKLKFDNKQIKVYSVILLIAVAYAANIGGTATLVGTPPNVQLAGIMETQFHQKIEFSSWLMIGVPFSILLLALTFFMFRFFMPKSMLKKNPNAHEIELEAPGKISYQEIVVLIIFVLTAFLWTFKSLLNEVLPFELSDTIIAMAAGVSFFLIPSKQEEKRILEWEDMKNLPWGILILFGGGLSLALAMKKVGILQDLAEGFISLGIENPLVILIGFTFIALFITEIMSNVAMVVVFVPVVAEIAADMNINPLYYSIPVTLAASCAFMLPMATPPNALVFATEKIKVGEMVRFGVILNIISVIIIVFLAHFYFGSIFGF